MAQSPETIVNSIDDAIYALTVGGASSYSIGARSVTKLDIPGLLEARDYYQALADRASGGGMFRLAKFTRTSE